MTILRKVRVLSGLSSEEVAERIGITRQRYVGLERGEKGASSRTAARIAAMFETQITSLFAPDLKPLVL